MKLIYAQGACSLSVHILLEELKVPYQGIKVSLKDKKVLESYNPKSYVPALILDNGAVMTEAISILQNLSVEHKSAFMPSDPFERAKCIEWLTYFSSELHKGAGPLFHKADLTEKFIQETVQKLEKRLMFLEEQLSDQAFIIGNSYTIADMYAVAILRILEHVGIQYDNFPNIRGYKENLESSPVIKNVIEMEASARMESAIKDPNEKLIFHHREGSLRSEMRS